MDQTFMLPITEPSQVGQARRRAVDLSRQLGLDETEAGKVALVVTEAANNIVQHTSGGEVVVRVLEAAPVNGIELLALDRGPGMDVSLSVRDGYSTAGTPGNGLGAMMRLASSFDLYSLPGQGTALVAEVWQNNRIPRGSREPLQIGGVGVSKSGEEVCGDAWAVAGGPDCTSILIADGLGHGLGAAEAAREAKYVFEENPNTTPREIVELIHAALKKTRGAAVALAEIDLPNQIVHFVGVGNISASLVEDDGGRGRVSHFVSHNGTVGHEVRKIQEFNYPWTNERVLIMHSDGLAGHWDLRAYPGLLAHHPSLIAGVLYRDFTRHYDDVTVVVAKHVQDHSRRAPERQAPG